MRLVFDIETDGLLDTLTVIHSLVVKDVDTGKVWSCSLNASVHTIDYGLELLWRADEIIGHNIIKFDIPALQKLYPWFNPQGKITDTLVLTRLLYPAIADSDFKRVRIKRLPSNLIGSHSLEAWGYRLGKWKGDYSHMMKEKGLDPWASWNPEMQEYCEQDVEVTETLWRKMMQAEPAPMAVELEHQTAILCAKIERNGFPFDTEKAIKLWSELAAKKQKVEAALKAYFGGWWASNGTHTPKRTITFKDTRRQSYIENAPFTRIEWTEFNPASRDHIALCLTNRFGWVPEVFTDGGKPKVDETVLSTLDYEPVPLLIEYFLLNKRLGQLAEGDQAWLKREVNGKIHGSINTNNAVTGRATHSYPNIAQVPRVKKHKERGVLWGAEGLYGADCRQLFHADGWPMVGTDMSGLELRCLGHFLAYYDEGKFIQTLLEGDIHTANMEAAGLSNRDQAKTFIYAFLYGAGDEKIGKIVGGDKRDGKRLKANFFAKMPAVKQLIEAVKAKVNKQGFLYGLDGRKLHIRSDHAALNTLLQSAGALTCKKWMVLLEEDLLSRGYKHGWDGDFVFLAWVHDELQIAARTPELAEEIGKLSAECAAKAGEFFKFRCPLTADYQIGNNWMETH